METIKKWVRKINFAVAISYIISYIGVADCFMAWFKMIMFCYGLSRFRVKITLCYYLVLVIVHFWLLQEFCSV